MRMSTLASRFASASPARAFAESSLAPATQEAYRRDWADFCAWAAQAGVVSLPAGPGSVAEYISAMASLVEDGVPVYSPATISRRLAAINAYHERAMHPSPTKHPAVTVVLAGIRRQLAPLRPVERMEPLLRDDVDQIVRHLPTTWPACVGSTRDKALILLGWVGAFRRSELAAVRVSDLRLESQGATVLLRTSKTDSRGKGLVKAIPRAEHLSHLCPVCALVRWLRVANAQTVEESMALSLPSRSRRHDCPVSLPRDLDEESRLFVVTDKHGNVGKRPLSGHGIAAVVAKRAHLAGLHGSFGGHSLRSGFVSEALRRGASFAEVMGQTGHQNPSTVETYNRRLNPFSTNAVNSLGL